MQVKRVISHVQVSTHVQTGMQYVSHKQEKRRRKRTRQTRQHKTKQEILKNLKSIQFIVCTYPFEPRRSGRDRESLDESVHVTLWDHQLLPIPGSLIPWRCRNMLKGPIVYP